MQSSIKFPECNNVAVKKLSAGTVQTANLTGCQGDPLILFTIETMNRRLDVPFGSVVRFLHDDSVSITLSEGSANLTFSAPGARGATGATGATGP